MNNVLLGILNMNNVLLSAAEMQILLTGSCLS